MIKKYFLLTIIFFIFFIPPNLAAETKRTPLRDELPNLKRLSDYTIGERRVVKALKYEDRGKYKKANKLYSYIDQSNFYKNDVDEESRSIMNVPFLLGDDSLNNKFLEESEENGLLNLAGHRSVGGMRASIYNGVPEEGVDALIDFMKEFERKNC